MDLHIIEHPLVANFLTILRSNKTDGFRFKSTLDRLSYILASLEYANLELKKVEVQTPMMKSKGMVVKDNVVLLPILRAGIGLLNGFLDLFPGAMVSYIGIYRNEQTLEPVKYYFKFPKIKNMNMTKVYVLDPMIATGGSMTYTLNMLKDIGIKRVNVVSLLCAPEGLKRIDKEFKGSDFKVDIITCAVDKKLNKFGYILPGLGDAGDRYFGT